MSQAITKPKTKEVTPAEIQKRFEISVHVLVNLVELAKRDNISLVRYVGRQVIDATKNNRRWLEEKWSKAVIGVMLKEVGAKLRPNERVLFQGFGLKRHTLELLKINPWDKKDVNIQEKVRKALESCSEDWDGVKAVCYNKRATEANRKFPRLAIKLNKEDRIEIHLPKDLHDRFMDKDRDDKESLMVNLSSWVNCFVIN